MASVTEPSSPDLTKQQQILFVIKTVLKILASVGIFAGAPGITDQQWLSIIGAAIMLGEWGMSYWQSHHQAQLDHAGNIASARAGQATRVVAVQGGITDV